MVKRMLMDAEATLVAPSPEVVKEEAPAEHEAHPEAGGAGQHGEGIHLPPTSLWPITAAFAIVIAASGLVTNWMVSLPGFVLFVIALRGWAQELLDAQH
jgi:Cytochrome c oxidase subunit IV